MAHSWNIEVKVQGCYLRNVATELFALKKALLKNEIKICQKIVKMYAVLLEGDIALT
jgi:hypothetical protein